MNLFYDYYPYIMLTFGITITVSFVVTACALISIARSLKKKNKGE